LLLEQKEKDFHFQILELWFTNHQQVFKVKVTDIEIHANEVSSLKKRLNEIYSKHTGKSVDEVKSALERDNFMTAEVAKDFGLIDEVVEKRS
jgi:ATP-dependent Clp protease protease subunit